MCLYSYTLLWITWWICCFKIWKRICGFFAECSAETDNGFSFLEAADESVNPTRTDINYWFDNNKKYLAKYRGAGAIQLTWDDNYKAFQSWMETRLQICDSNIIDKGEEYVAMTYPWEAAVFFGIKIILTV